MDSYFAATGDRRRQAEEGFATHRAEDNIELVPPRERGRGHYALFFAVLKKNGKARACYDQRRVNRSLVVPHFKMEGLPVVRSLLRRDDYMTSVDIKSAYPHIPIAPEHRQFFRFVWRGEHYQFKAMPFGLATAPLIWTKLMKPVLAYLRARGVWVTAYIDDLLILAASPELARQHTALVIETLERLGLTVNYEKSELNPE